MSTSSVVVAVTPHKNGRNGHPTTSTPLTAVSLGWIGEAIDRLADLRAERERVEKAERELSGAVLAFLRDHNMPALRATRATATVVERTTLAPDVALFIEAVGGVQPAAPALRVLVEKARLLLGEADLMAISETTTSPILRVDRLQVSG